MVKTLVTGGAGFIGSHVARHCIALGHDVIILDDLSGGFKDQVPPKATFIEGSVCDQRLLESIFSNHQFDYVYHLAAYAAEGLSHFIRRFNYENNLIGSVNLINESVKHKVKCFVFTSSIAVYGAGQPPMTEDMTPMPEDPYGVAKYSVELDLKAAYHLFGLNSIIFRPHNVYGENQNIGDRYRNVIGIFMNQIMKGEPLTVFGDGEQTRAFSYIDDVAPVIAKSVLNQSSYNQIFNIGADVPYTINKLIEVIAREFDVQPNVRHLSARNEVVHAHCSHEKVHSYFGNISPVSLEEGIRCMAAWVKGIGAREGTRFSNIEILENMPAVWRD